MSVPTGPGFPFTLLFDEDGSDGLSLPEAFQTIYGGDWRLPAMEARPYVYVNFALSHDGRISFAEPGHAGGGDVSGFNDHDRWLMGLLRARADAVLVGDVTLQIEPDHLWTPEYIYPEDGPAFSDLRRREGRPARPLTVFLSLTGELYPSAAVWKQPEFHLIVATTRTGSRRVRELQCAGRLDVLDLGEERADPAALVQLLHERYGVRTLLCEGGARVYGSLLEAGQVDEEFLTYCPMMIGNRPSGPARPGLVEGVAFMPGTAPQMRPVSLRRAGDHLFFRSRYYRGEQQDRAG